MSSTARFIGWNQEDGNYLDQNSYCQQQKKRKNYLSPHPITPTTTTQQAAP
jgi:hypothetical protein